MKIGVVADTHSQPVPKQLLKDFQNVDLIVHAGDFCTQDDLKVFQKIGEVKAVYGNMDDRGIRGELPEQLIFPFKGFQIGVYHGVGPQKRVPEFVQEKFKGEKVDAVIFGHSHNPFNEVIEGVLYFNPGSPTDSISAPYLSYGIIEVKAGKLQGKIKRIK